MTDSFLKKLTKLIHTYKTVKELTPSDFVNQCFTYEDQEVQKRIIYAFLNYSQYELLLENVAKLFFKEYNFFHAQKENVMIQIYFVIFILNSDNIQEIIGYSQYYTRELLQFLLTDKNHKSIAREGCRYFENEHVLQKVIDPFLAKQSLIESVMNSITDKHLISTTTKKCTVPVEFKFRNRLSQSPGPPVNTPIEYRSFYAIDPPLSTIYPQIGIVNKIFHAHVKNKKKAEELLKEAACMPPRLTEPTRPSQKVEETKSTLPSINPIPPKKIVETKENLTTTLREASRLLKQQEQEIKTIQEIIKGGCSLQKVKEIQEEYKKIKDQQEIEIIQKKRLQVLLSYEEALIAKKRLLVHNKEKVKQLKDAKAQMLEKLEDWRVEEQIKIKNIVEKCQKSKKDFKELNKKLIEDKQNQVRLQQNASKEILQKVDEENKRELAKKIELIQEIKAIHAVSIQMNGKKRFDPTETLHLGLFCEMSIAELQERLILAKIRMKEDLDAKRQRILEKKVQQKQAIDNVKNFIAQSRRMSKTKTVPTCSSKLERSPDLFELEKLLYERRCLRMKII